MKLTAQATVIDSITHILFSPQWGTECGIRGRVKEENIINVTDDSEITCPACLDRMNRTMALLRK